MMKEDLNGTKVKTKYWNIFKNEPRKDEIGSAVESKFFRLAEKALLVLAYIVTFLVVLAGCVVARGITFFMIAQISVKNRNNIPFCNGDVKTGFYIDDAQEKELEVDLHCSNLSGQELVDCLYSLGVERSAWIWCLFFAFAFPNLGAFLRSLRMWLFKKQEAPRIKTFLVVLVMECAHAVGMALLLFLVLPELDSLRAMALTAGIGTVPCIFNMISRKDTTADHTEQNEKGKNGFNWMLFLVDCLALTAQLSALFLWSITQGSADGKIPPHPYPWAIPLALFLVTCPYWETYIGRDFGFKSLWHMKKELLEDSRYFVYVIVTPIKMMLFFGCMVLFVFINGSITSDNDKLNFGDIFFNNFLTSFGNHTFTVKEITTDSITSDAYSDGITQISYYFPSIDNTSTPVYVLLIQICCGYAAYVVSKFASKVQIGLFSFAAPVTLALPITMLILVLSCGSVAKDECAFASFMPHNLQFECPDLGDFASYSWDQQVWVVLIWFVSFLWITGHIWFPRSTRLASSEQIFSLPWYEGLFIDQMLMLNRRKDGDLQTRVVDKDVLKDEKNRHEAEHNYFGYTDLEKEEDDTVFDEDKLTRIKACATMWHENKEEMTEMLKSLFRVDMDYITRKLAQERLQVADPDYYEWETHILFDDSMNRKNKEKQLDINDFVKLLVETIHEEAAKFYKPFNNDAPVSLAPCKRKPAPYGGRIEWQLPGGTEVIVHLKVNEKIRHKKRWSQCMYMYYLLGYQIMDDRTLTEARKNERAKNTYILALDGDIDFQPHSIIKLVDMMKKNSKVGAACGRIHPTGSGYMPWYQKFEYAIGHWLQKATEHVLGCVLCSPGCFSLFRGEALMDNNVMRKYTTVSSEARHYVQFDQGEDRWLCTLLLQQGWRVEYSAASDAFTACPTGFEEFYNQRRRWMPSTIMNIIDLLADYKHVIEMNPDISIFYIIYQGFLMVSTFIGPGAIFLVIAGAFNALFALDMWYCILMLAVPVLGFMASCYYLTQAVQLKIAKLLTVCFVLVMAAVFITIFVQIMNESWISPTAISFLSVFGAFFLAGVLHPYEISCLLYMLVYYFTIPSMYLLLVIYSLFNMNDVSWGTRETPKDEGEEKKEKLEQVVQAAKPEDQGMFNNLLAQLNLGGKKGQKGGMEMSLGNLCSCLFFTHDDPEEKTINKISETLLIVDAKVTDLQKQKNNTMEVHRTDLKNKTAPGEKTALPKEIRLNPEKDEVKDSKKQKHDLRKEEANPYWLDKFFEEDKNGLGDGPVEHLPSSEKHFWDDLIKEYLTPLTMTTKQVAEQKKGLEEFRDQLVFTFVMVNFMWVIAITLMQNEKQILSVKWPLDVKYNVTYNELAEQGPELEMYSTSLILEPIGLFFLVAFLGVMLLQIIGMFLHRWTSFSHTIATTKLGKDAIEAEEALNYIKQILTIDQEDDNAPEKSKSSKIKERRGTVAHLLADNVRTEKVGGNLNIMATFERKHSLALNDENGDMGRRLSAAGIRRDTLANIKRRASVAERRSSVLEARRQSFVPGGMAPRRDSGMFMNNRRNSGAFNNRKNSAVRFSIDSKQGTENPVYEDSDYGVSLASLTSSSGQDNRFEISESQM